MKDQIYSVLIVSASATFHAVLKPLLPQSNYAPVCSVYSVHEAKKTLKQQTFDLIIIDTPLPDASGKLFAMDICAAQESILLLFVKSELHAEVSDEVAAHGIFTLAKPTSKAIITQAILWMTSARERLRQNARSAEKKLAEVRIVNKAKWILIRELKLSEPDAHHYIEKQAMDRCISKRQIAEDIIKMYSL